MSSCPSAALSVPYPACVHGGAVSGSATHEERTREGSAAFQHWGCRNVPGEAKVIPTEMLKTKCHLTSSSDLLPRRGRALPRQQQELSSFTVLLRGLIHRCRFQRRWQNARMKWGRTELCGVCILTTWWKHLTLTFYLVQSQIKSDKPNLGIRKCVAMEEEL